MLIHNIQRVTRLSTLKHLSRTTVIFQLVLLADQMPVIGDEMSVITSRFANGSSQIKQIQIHVLR